MENRTDLRSLVRVAFCLACLVIAPATDALAGASDLLPPKPDSTGFEPVLGTYSYLVDFKNVRIGTIDLTIHRENDLYKVQVLAKTVNMFDRIYRIRYRGEAVIDSNPFAPVQTTVQQQVRSRERATTTIFQPGGAIKTQERKSEDGEVAYETRNIQPERFMLDPFSATYLARGFDWKAGTEKVFDVFPGKGQYEIRLKCERLVMLDMGGVKRPAWVITPTAVNLDPEKQAEAARKSQAAMKIYLSADEQKDVLRIEASHMLGNLTVFLDKFQPAIYQASAAK